MSVQFSFRVEGMTGANCSSRVERVIKRLPGVDEANVNLATEKANVVVGDGGPAIDELFGQVEKAGYHPVAERLEMGVGGMTCQHCERAVSEALSGVPGVKEVVAVSHKRDEAVVEGAPDMATLIAAVKEEGYGAEAAQ